MSASRTERLLNLLIALLNTRYGLRRSELREKIYHDSGSSDVSFGRMFERDKNDLRQFGFEVETVTDKGWGSDDPATTRYRIGKESNRLPDVSLTPEECTVLILASQLWEQAALGRPRSVPCASSRQRVNCLLRPNFPLVSSHASSLQDKPSRTWLRPCTPSIP
ncbi:hypothetical protein ACW0JT_15245 [Arthrobacter sp. SA17]